jgi:pyruvate dehydrogenase E1 component alpha subunit
MHDQLFDPNLLHDPIALNGSDTDLFVEWLRKMTLIRKSEEKIGDLVLAKKVQCPCHLGIGQEAIGVGVAANLRTSDRVFGTHRSHSHFLGQGGDVNQLFAEIFGKFTGASKGMGGSMHLWDESIGFFGSVPIVGATISISVGAGLAASLSSPTKEDMDVGVCYFGDGATEEGTFHESMNLASRFKYPVLFVCENNLYSSHLHIDERQPDCYTARYAEAHRVNSKVVDGNDVVAVSEATRELLDSARNGGGPGFLEVITYRWRGHVGPSEDIDVGVQRKGDLKLWKKRDPIQRFVDALIQTGKYDQASWDKLQLEVHQRVEKAVELAEAAEFPPKSFTDDVVYSAGKGGVS